MKLAALTIASVLVVAAFVLFLGGLISAAIEIHHEKKTGLPVKRPGWRKADREPARCICDPSDGYTGPCHADYTVPKGTGLVIWGLVFIGRPDLAERYLVRREDKLLQRGRS